MQHGWPEPNDKFLDPDRGGPKQLDNNQLQAPFSTDIFLATGNAVNIPQTQRVGGASNQMMMNE